MRCQCGVSRLWDAPGAPLGAALSTGTDPKEIFCVGVHVENQELTVPTNVGILVLATPAARAPVLQPIICCGKVLIHLSHTRDSKVRSSSHGQKHFSIGGSFFFPLLTLHQRTNMPPGLSCSSSIWTGGWEETDPWRDTRSLSSPSRESSSWAETHGTSTNAGTSGKLGNT